MRLQGRGVLVVDGGSARAGAIAAAAADAGAIVVLSVPPGSEGEVADPSREEDVERLFGTAAGRIPRLDVVVSVAPDPSPRRLLETSLADWEAAVSRTLRGAFLVSRMAVEEFLAHGEGGRLVHVAPLARAGAPAQSLAAASLQGLLSLVRSTAKEYGARRVACNAVLPAPVPGADAVTEAVLFLASSEASYLNGEALRVASGQE